MTTAATSSAGPLPAPCPQQVSAKAARCKVPVDSAYVCRVLDSRRASYGGPPVSPKHELQVLVDTTDAEQIDKGKWINKHDETIFNVRIPHDAGTEPHYGESRITFDLAQNVEAIGSTGWNWVDRRSDWVGFDFDAIVGHAGGGLPADELEFIAQDIADMFDFVEVRRSSGGKGLHLFAYLDGFETKNHTEHAAVAKVVLAEISRYASVDLQAKVDVLGGNFWLWHRKRTPENRGYELISAARGRLDEWDLPGDWRAQVKTHGRGKVRTAGPGAFDEFSVKTLEDEHRRHIDWLMNSGFTTIWDEGLHLLRTHTVALARMHKALGLQGTFETISQGTDPSTPNCFACPRPNGQWFVKRYGNVKEPSWL